MFTYPHERGDPSLVTTTVFDDGKPETQQLIESIRETKDVHAVCMIFDPTFKNIALVHNDAYPKGKKPGFGLVGGRSEKIPEREWNRFLQKIDPSIRKAYSLHEHEFRRVPGTGDWMLMESPEATAIREAFEESRIRIQILRLFHEGAVPKSGTRDAHWRCIFICVALNRGDETTRALDEKTGHTQTLGFRWVPCGIPQDEIIPGVKIYFTHKNTIWSNPWLADAVADVVKDNEERLADLRYLWKHYGSA